MFFVRDPTIKIDGVTYEVSNGATVDTWNCKTKLCDLWQLLNDDTFENEIVIDRYVAFKKEIIKELKDFDRKYVAHAKKINPEINKIHMQGMEPLTNLFESNKDFYDLR